MQHHHIKSDHDAHYQAIHEQKRIIRRMKRALVLFVIAITLGTATYIGLNTKEESPLISQEDDLAAIREYAIEPIYRFSDDDQRYHVVRADWGRVSKDNSDEILLKEIRGDSYQADNAVARFTIVATGGILNRKSQRLTLLSGVQLQTHNGYDIRTDTAQLLLNRRTASGDDAVTIHHPRSVAQATGFRITDDGATIQLRGPATITLLPQKP